MRLIFAVSAFLICSMQGALAGDYTVNYAMDTGDEQESGKAVVCEDRKSCVIKLKIRETEIILNRVPRSNNIYVHVLGPSGFCYFSDGEPSISLEPKESLHLLAVFEGHARRGNEYILNQKIGVLYIGLSNFR